MIDLKQAGIDLGLAIAGLFGSLLMSSKQAGESLPRTLVSLIGGAASANYVTPLILKLAHLDGEPQYSYAAAFLLGFCGLRAVETLSNKLFVPTPPTETDEPNRTHKRRR
jgi:hypothetical protein